ncbi:hypothetical protein RB595_006810 [Gaeumannomyces hyphopodioides]
MMLFPNAISWAILAGQALAHSHIAYIVVNGQMFRGYDAKAGDTPAHLANPPAQVVAWSARNPDDGFVSPDNYTSPDMICHRDGAPAVAHAPVSPGDGIHIQWNGWPQSHVGPALSYLARCGGGGGDSGNASAAAAGGCADVNKEDLRFFKIDNSSPVLLAPTTGRGGRWVSDVLIERNNSWQVRVPRNLAPGPYVLRHELIALHYAAKSNGAQNYPQCINLWVKAGNNSSSGGGGGSAKSWGPGAVGYGQGVSPTAMYGRDDAGILIDVNQPLSTYRIPGPTLVSGAEPIPATAQAISLPTAWGTAVRVVSGSMTVALPVSETFVPRPPPS